MKRGIQEVLAVSMTITVLVGLPVIVFQNGPSNSSGNVRVIHLTGVMKSGVWTDEEVNGLNYWWKSFRPATITLRKGEEILLRLTSSDGTHSFYVPELGIGPIQIEAGHTKEILLKANHVGEFTYYCTTVCGECHYFMRGIVRVVRNTTDIVLSDTKISSECILHDPPENFTSFVAKGEYLYTYKGCVACHGDKGKGGVNNPNYVNEFVPHLDNLADKMKIYWEEDADTIIKLFESNVDFMSLEDEPPIDNYSRFLAQYQSISNKILNGSPVVQKLDTEKPEPPLTMPAWEEQLSENDINSILAYLISLYPWDEYE